MTVNEIYGWLLTTDPVKNSKLRPIWSNMASYCYFINSMDFNHTYRDKLQTLLQKSSAYGINIPDKKHKDVIGIAECVNSKTLSNCIESLLYEK